MIKTRSDSQNRPTIRVLMSDLTPVLKTHIFFFNSDQKTFLPSKNVIKRSINNRRSIVLYSSWWDAWWFDNLRFMWPAPSKKKWTCLWTQGHKNSGKTQTMPQQKITMMRQKVTHENIFVCWWALWSRKKMVYLKVEFLPGSCALWRKKMEVRNAHTQKEARKKEVTSNCCCSTPMLMHSKSKKNVKKCKWRAFLAK